MDKLVLLSFGGYLGEIESEKKELRGVDILFFVNGQCCVNVRASNFKFYLVTRQSGGGRAF